MAKTATPIVPTEGVSVGTITPAPDPGLIDPSTGHWKSEIKEGKQPGAELKGCGQPNEGKKITSTPALETPVS